MVYKGMPLHRVLDALQKQRVRIKTRRNHFVQPGSPFPLRPSTPTFERVRNSREHGVRLKSDTPKEVIALDPHRTEFWNFLGRALEDLEPGA